VADGVYAVAERFYQGWPIATGPGDEPETWPVHCYGSVGVGRDMPPDSGSGAELYAVIGNAPRQLDRNIAVVGRVISGMEWLSSLPRGKGDAGFYQKPGSARRSPASGWEAMWPGCPRGSICRPTARVLPPISMRGPIGAIRSTCGLPAGWISAMCRCRFG
jgi:hypothetical protein